VGLELFGSEESEFMRLEFFHSCNTITSMAFLKEKIKKNSTMAAEVFGCKFIKPIITKSSHIYTTRLDVMTYLTNRRVGHKLSHGHLFDMSSVLSDHRNERDYGTSKLLISLFNTI